MITDIAVGISTLDRPEGLARCLDALLASPARPREIVIVDQGAPDAPDRIVSDRASRGVPIHHVRQPRRGLSASRNGVLTATSCPVIAVTDDDCVPAPGWLAALARAFASTDAVAAVTGPVLPLGPETPGTYAVASRASMVRAEYAGMAVPWNVGTGGNFAVRRTWIERVGGYDERLGAGAPGLAGEDLDVIHRLLRAGARIRYEPDAIVHHERKSLARRRATRGTYGHGVGACVGIWLRDGDLRSLPVLGRWLLLRGWLLATALGSGRWSRVGEETLVLGGTARGIAYGLRAGRSRRAGGPAASRRA